MVSTFICYCPCLGHPTEDQRFYKSPWARNSNFPGHFLRRDEKQHDHSITSAKFRISSIRPSNETSLWLVKGVRLSVINVVGEALKINDRPI